MGLFQRFLRPKKKRARIQSAPPGRSAKDLLVTAPQPPRSNSSDAVLQPLQPPIDCEESSTLSLSGQASPPKRARANRTPHDWNFGSPGSEPGARTPPLAYQPPKLRPLPAVSSRSSKKLSPRSAAAELVNARAGQTIPSDGLEKKPEVQEAGQLQEGSKGRARVPRRLSYNTGTPATRSLPPSQPPASRSATSSQPPAARSLTPNEPRTPFTRGDSKPQIPMTREDSKPQISMSRDDSLDVVDYGSPSLPARSGTQSPMPRPALAVLHGGPNSPMPNRSHGPLGAPHTLRPPAKHPETTKLVNRHRHSSSTPSPSTFATPARLAARRQRTSPPSLSGLHIIGATAAPQPAARDAESVSAEAVQTTRQSEPVRNSKSVQWVNTDVAVVFNVERVAKDAWGEASADYKRNMQTLNMVRRTVPAGTSFAKCVLKLDHMEGGEGVSVLSGPAGKVMA